MAHPDFQQMKTSPMQIVIGTVEIVLGSAVSGGALTLSQLQTLDAWFSVGLKGLGFVTAGLTIWLLIIRIRNAGRRGGQDREDAL